MKKMILSSFAVTALTLACVGCDVDVEEEGEMPEVDVQPGEMPEMDVETADVDVETETKEVEVPSGIDVEMPDDEQE